MISKMGSVADAYSRALPFLGMRSFARYLLIPVLVNIALLGLIVFLAVIYAAPLADALLSVFNIPPDSWLAFLNPVLAVVLTGVVIVLYLLVYKYLVLTVSSPFLALLSEKVEEEQTGRVFPFSWRQLSKDLLRAAVINFRNFFFELLATILLALFSFIPVLGLLGPIALLLIQSYFFGFALMDFNAERHRLDRRATERWMRGHFWQVSGIGVVFYFVFLIPIVGWFLAPVWSTIAGTLVWLEVEEQSPGTV